MVTTEPPIGLRQPPRSAIATARRLKANQWRLLGEALVALTLASIAIARLPFRTVVARAARQPRAPQSDHSPAPVRDLVWAVEAVARRLPWRTVCFQKGLALHAMIQRRGVTSRLHYGIGKRDEGGLAAHVWVVVDDTIVMGGDVVAQFRCVATYPPSG